MPSDYEREWQTRKKRIDTRLVAIGWTVAAFVENKSLATYDRCAVTEFPTQSGPAEYALAWATASSA